VKITVEDYADAHDTARLAVDVWLVEGLGAGWPFELLVEFEADEREQVYGLRWADDDETLEPVGFSFRSPSPFPLHAWLLPDLETLATASGDTGTNG
jgi:hypothetical protein